MRIMFILTGFDDDGVLVTEVELPAEIDPRAFCDMPADDADLRPWYPASLELVERTLALSRFTPEASVVRWEIACQRLHQFTRFCGRPS